MVDLAVTGAQVQAATSGANFGTAIAGEAITPGEPIYLDSSDGGKAKLGDSNDSAKAVIVGIAVGEAAAAGQQITYQKNGTWVIGAGAAPTAGEVYVLSDTAGGIAANVDAAAGEYITIIGVGSLNTTSGIEMGRNGPTVTGIVHA